jgi:transketolase
MSKDVDVNALQDKARVMRRKILEILHTAGSGHPGGSLSAVEIFIALYHAAMRHQPEDPQWADRDRLIISKGHASAAAYVILAQCGYFPEDELKRYRKFQSPLQGHVHTRTPGIEFNTGSLGHGLSVANGIALGARMRRKDINVYCLLGDGELQEGSIWEAAMTAPHYKLGNVCAIVDYNKVQENGPTNVIKNLDPLSCKWDSFGWQTCEVNGHDFQELISALDHFRKTPEKPTVILAHTVKGKGVSFMEGQPRWHGKAPGQEQLKQALLELSRKDVER